MTFELDTSGTVFGCGPDGRVRWADLDPFTQGYILAALENVAQDGWLGDLFNGHYRDLAPELLDMMLADCAEAQRDVFIVGREEPLERRGRLFFLSRQTGRWLSFPPLTLYINDQGRLQMTHDPLQAASALRNAAGNHDDHTPITVPRWAAALGAEALAESLAQQQDAWDLADNIKAKLTRMSELLTEVENLRKDVADLL